MDFKVLRMIEMPTVFEKEATNLREITTHFTFERDILL